MLIESCWHKQDSISVRAFLISLCFNVMAPLIRLNVRLAEVGCNSTFDGVCICKYCCESNWLIASRINSSNNFCVVFAWLSVQHTVRFHRHRDRLYKRVSDQSRYHPDDITCHNWFSSHKPCLEAFQSMSTQCRHFFVRFRHPFDQRLLQMIWVDLHLLFYD